MLVSSPSSTPYSDRKRLSQLRNVFRSAIFDKKIDLLGKLWDKQRQLAESRRENGGLMRPGLLPGKSVIKVLKECGLKVSDNDAVLLVEKFGDFRGVVNFEAFYRFLDVLPPDDYVDPALREERLPQPYRMLVKILEENVLDQAWEQIKNRNPSIDREKSSSLRKQKEMENTVEADDSNHLRRRSMSQSMCKIERQKEALKQVNKQRIRKCLSLKSPQISSLSCVTESKCHSASFIGTQDGKIQYLGCSDEVLNPAATFQVFGPGVEEEAPEEDKVEVKPITHVACSSELNDGSFIVIVVSSSFRGNQNNFFQDKSEVNSDGSTDNVSGGASFESVQSATTSKGKPETKCEDEVHTSYMRVLNYSPLRPVGSGFEAYTEIIELEDTSVVDLWIGEIPGNRFEGTITLGLMNGARIQADVVGLGIYRLNLVPNRVGDPSNEGQDEAAACEPPLTFLKQFEFENGRIGKIMVHFTADGRHALILRENGFHIYKYSLDCGVQLEYLTPSLIRSSAYYCGSQNNELLACGLESGCTVILRVCVGIFFAKFRRQVGPVTSVLFHQVRDPSSPEAVVQILCGCSDGLVRLYQLVSPLPAAGAILDRTFVSEDRGLKALNMNFSLFLTGVEFIMEFSEYDLDEGSEAIPDEDATYEVSKLRKIPGLELWVCVSRCTDRTGRLPTLTEIKIYDMELATNIGKLCRGGKEQWPDGADYFFQKDSIIVLDKDQSPLAEFNLIRYLPQFYPTIAIKCGVPTEMGASGKFQPNGLVATRKLHQALLEVFRDSTALQRTGETAFDRSDVCNLEVSESTTPQKSIVSTNSSSLTLSQDDITQRVRNLSRESSRREHARSTQTSSPCSDTPNKKSKMKPRTPMREIGFAEASKITMVIKSKQVQAGRNLVNPTILAINFGTACPISIESNFEQARRATRAKRDALVKTKLENWAGISSGLM